MSSILRAQEHNTQNIFWEPGDDHKEPSFSDVRSCRLFVSNHLHSFYCLEYNYFAVTVTLFFHKNFISLLITEYYAFTIIICFDDVNFFVRSLGSVWGLIAKIGL